MKNIVKYTHSNLIEKYKMPLIKPKKKIELKVLKISIDSDVLDEINAYKNFVGSESLDECINESVKFVLKNDKEWIKFKKEKSKVSERK
jgi:hypothetical protein